MTGVHRPLVCQTSLDESRQQSVGKLLLLPAAEVQGLLALNRPSL